MEANLGHLLVLQEARDHEPSRQPRVSFVDSGNSAVRVVHEVLSPNECTSLIRAAEALNFSAPKNFEARDRVCERVHTVDTSLSIPMMSRLHAFLPEIVIVDGARWRLTRFTHHWRFVRYYKGGHFAPHYDGSKLLPWYEMSMFTVQVYLNSQGEDFSGGATRFYMDHVPIHQASHSITDGQSMRAHGDGPIEPTHAVQPRAGDVLIFDHGGRSVFHDAEALTDGCKYILRGDVMYAAMEEDRTLLQQPSLPVELRKWCPHTAADFGTRDFVGQVWKCECAKDKHGSCSKHSSAAWQDYHSDISTCCSTCSEPESVVTDCRQRICVLVSGKRASGKDYVASILQPALEAKGLSVQRCAVGAINKKAYAAWVGIDAARLEEDREFKESHRIAMVQHHKARNARDPEWCLKELWRQADEACADVLLLTDFRTHEDYQWFLEKSSSRDKLVLLRIEASNEARLSRGWIPDPAKDMLYSETDLDIFSGWDACFDNSSDGSSEVVSEWITNTAVPRVLSRIT